MFLSNVGLSAKSVAISDSESGVGARGRKGGILGSEGITLLGLSSAGVIRPSRENEGYASYGSRNLQPLFCAKISL